MSRSRIARGLLWLGVILARRGLGRRARRLGRRGGHGLGRLTARLACRRFFVTAVAVASGRRRSGARRLARGTHGRAAARAAATAPPASATTATAAGALGPLATRRLESRRPGSRHRALGRCRLDARRGPALAIACAATTTFATTATTTFATALGGALASAAAALVAMPIPVTSVTVVASIATAIAALTAVCVAALAPAAVRVAGVRVPAVIAAAVAALTFLAPRRARDGRGRRRLRRRGGGLAREQFLHT
jgi:hypothetical protein